MLKRPLTSMLWVTAVCVASATWWPAAESWHTHAGTGLTTDTLVALAPVGQFLHPVGHTPVFRWSAGFEYAGTYNLKVQALPPDAPTPANLPDEGLTWLQAGISDTTWSYAAGAPPLMPGARYAWQVETNDLVDGERVRSHVVDIMPVAVLDCGISLAGVPAGVLCPGACFTLTVSLPQPPPDMPWLTYTHRFTVFANQALTANGLPAHALAGPCDTLHAPQVTLAGNADAYEMQVCVGGAAAGAVSVAILYERPSTDCDMPPCGTGCCYDTVGFDLVVADFAGFADMAVVARNLLGHALTQADTDAPVNFVLEGAPVGQQPVWQCWEGGAWQDIPAATGRAFVARPAELFSLQCQGSATGSWDKLLRVKFVLPAPDGGPVCELLSPAYPLKVCCPLSRQAALIVTPDGPFCEGGQITFEVTLTSPDAFVQTPGSDVSINWEVTGLGDIGFQNQLSFSFPATLIAEEMTVTARISHCGGGNVLRVSASLGNEPAPVCGGIHADSPNLTEVFEDPLTGAPLPDGDRAYVICPKRDAVLLAPDVQHCTPIWQYSDDEGAQWQAIGSRSNTTQNTNIIFPPAAGCRWYRLMCEPMTDPSGCEPCYSNVVRICEKPTPMPLVFNCAEAYCAGDPVALVVANPEPGVTYTWFLEGVPVATGPTPQIAAGRSGCYWVEADSGCKVVASEACCVTVSRVAVRITCPVPPNECALFGNPVTLIGIANTLDAPFESWVYIWNWMGTDGMPQSATGPTLTDTPPLTGRLYRLTVTHPLTGCEATSTSFVKPCLQL